MSKDTISVNMNVYDIPIVVEQLKKLEAENKQLKEKIDILLEDNNQLEEIRIKAIEKITDDRYSPIERLMLIKAILGDKENE